MESIDLSTAQYKYTDTKYLFDLRTSLLMVPHESNVNILLGNVKTKIYTVFVRTWATRYLFLRYLTGRGIISYGWFRFFCRRVYQRAHPRMSSFHSRGKL